jgi:hypothetical protein
VNVVAAPQQFWAVLNALAGKGLAPMFVKLEPLLLTAMPAATPSTIQSVR